MEPVTFLDKNFHRTLGEIDYLIAQLNQNKIHPNIIDNCVKTAFDQLQRQFSTHECNATEKNSLKTLQKKVKDLSSLLKKKSCRRPDLEELSSEIDKVIDLGVIKTTFRAASNATFFENISYPAKFIYNCIAGKLIAEVNKLVYLGWAKQIKNQDLKNRIETRALLTQIGGKRIELVAADHVKLDATYLSSASFFDKLKEHKAERVRLELNDGSTINGFYFLENNEELSELLCKLNLVDSKDKDGAGYCLVSNPHYKGQFFLISKQDLTDKQTSFSMHNGNFKCDKAGNYCFNPNALRSTSFEPLPLNSQELKLEKLKDFDSPAPKYVHFQDGSKLPVFASPTNDRSLTPGLIRLKIPSRVPGGSDSLFYYAKAEDVKRLVKEEKMTLQANGNYHWDLPKLSRVTEEENEARWLECLNSAGAAILTSGNAGIYEMHKGEALALLMQGMDVMLLNLRGYGGSEGTPSVDGSYLDMEAAYQFVKQERPGIPDSKMVAWAMCLSGGIAARLVEKHPEMNLFLNQTYANIHSIIEKQVRSNIFAFLGIPEEKRGHTSLIKWTFANVVAKVAYWGIKFFAPNYRVFDRLANVKGKVCTLQALSDDVMSPKDTAAMSAVMKKHKVEHYNCVIPGKHSSNWTQVVVPAFTLIRGNGDSFEVGLHEYLKIQDGKSAFYAPKELLDSHKGFVMRGKTYRRDVSKDHYAIAVDNEPLRALVATEIEGNEGPAFLNALMKSKKAKDGSARWVYLGHRQINKFLNDAKLGNQQM